MHTEVYYLDQDNPMEPVGAVSSALSRGEICIIPTDTVYGIVALDGFHDAIRRIYELKQRPPEKQLIRLIGSFESVAAYTAQEMPERLKKFWPGPLTVIFRARSGDTIALRYPENRFLALLFDAIGPRALVAPSANVSGGEVIRECGRILSAFGGKVPVIVCLREAIDDRQPSTLIDISGKKWRILRQGSVRVPLD